MRLPIVFVLGAVLAACGGSSPPYDGPVRGRLEGVDYVTVGTIAVTPAPESCLWYDVTWRDVTALRIDFSKDFTTDQLLGAAAACWNKPLGLDLLVDLIALGNLKASTAFPPGTYPLSPSYFWGAWLAHSDATCKQVFPNTTSDGGTLTITAHDATHVAGHLYAFFPGGGSAEGTFDAPVAGWSYHTCWMEGLGGGVRDACPGGFTCGP